MKLKYLYSVLSPCYCQASRMFMDNIKPPKIKINNIQDIVCGEIIEKRYEVDDLQREHIKHINHCNVCSNKKLI